MENRYNQSAADMKSTKQKRKDHALMEYQVAAVYVNRESDVFSILRDVSKTSALHVPVGTSSSVPIHPEPLKIENPAVCDLVVRCVESGAEKILLKEHNPVTYKTKEFFITKNDFEKFRDTQKTADDKSFLENIQPSQRFMYLCENIGDTFAIVRLVANNKHRIGHIVDVLQVYDPSKISINYLTNGSIMLEVEPETELDAATMAGLEAKIRSHDGLVTGVKSSISNQGHNTDVLKIFRNEFKQ